MNFNQLLEKDFVLLDGAMGTMLQAKGLEAGELPELLGLERPDLIMEIHKNYIQAGSQIIYTNTLGANSYKLAGSGHDVGEIVKAAVNNAKKAAEGTDALVALDIGPIGQLLEPTGTLSFEDAYELFKEQVVAGARADVIVMETMTDLHEVKAAVLAAKENSNLPILCTMTFEENSRTFTGCSVSAMALTLEGLGVDAIGVNCSLGPKEVYPVLEELSKWTNLPIIAKPNAGMPDPLTNTYDISVDEFVLYMKQMAKIGVKFFGGCCGTNPEYIKALNAILQGAKFVSPLRIIPSAVCSSSDTVIIDRPRPIGEGLNPTGRKRLRDALVYGNMDYVLNLVIEQVEAGAEIIGVNAGMPEIDEKAVLVKVVKAIQSVTDVPLVIDSTIPEAIEAAVRVYNGKPIINSVNGEKKSMDSIFPIVKKYGGLIVCLTLDEKGIPDKAKDRVAIAEKIVKEAYSHGISKNDLIIDCLALTVSTEQDKALETLEAIRTVKEKLSLKTILGVSNISFGLPRRELINANFLAMALTCGLDLPIINVNNEQMMGCIKAYGVIAGHDKSAVNYIGNYRDFKGVAKEKNKEKSTGTGIAYAIENGLKKEVADSTEELLKDKEPLAIINEILIPVLDKVGIQFEKGDIFLPQLILAASATQSAFEVIKTKLERENGVLASKGEVILATVKGDVHDIGKNIVKVLLENYGYTVIDLGKNVEYQEVVDTVKKYNVKLVGLSALMTSTLASMKATISLLKENNLNCKVVVGGAVLTPEYAASIGADYYAKDAKETVNIAKKIFGE